MRIHLSLLRIHFRKGGPSTDIRSANQHCRMIVYIFLQPVEGGCCRERERRRRNATSLDDYEAVMNIYLIETKVVQDSGNAKRKKNKRKGRKKNKRKGRRKKKVKQKVIMEGWLGRPEKRDPIQNI